MKCLRRPQVSEYRVGREQAKEKAEFAGRVDVNVNDLDVEPGAP